MHEKEAVDLIYPVFDFFIAKEFKGLPSEDEFQNSLGCFMDFVKDPEPYWVPIKAKWVITRLLCFKEMIGDCPDTLKEAVLAVIRDARAGLGKEVKKELNASNSLKIRLDIDPPEFISLNSWGRISWTGPKKPPVH
jgi:hypothetical protein